MPLVTVRREGRAVRRTKASGSARNDSLGVGGTRAISSKRRSETGLSCAIQFGARFVKKIMLPSRNFPALTYIPRGMMMRTTFSGSSEKSNRHTKSFARLALMSLERIPNSSESASGKTL